MDPSCIGKVHHILAKRWLAYIIFSIIFFISFIYPIFNMCHLDGKIATTNHLIKIDSSSINYSRRNELTLAYWVQLLALDSLRKYCTFYKVHCFEKCWYCTYFFINKFLLFWFLENRFLHFTVNISHNPPFVTFPPFWHTNPF